MTNLPPVTDAESHASDEAARIVDRILARAGTAVMTTDAEPTQTDGDQLEREERSALRRVAGLSTELEDVTEVEYRKLRLERVVLIGLWSHSAESAEISLRELAALAETAGSQVLDALWQRRRTPDPGT